MFFWGSDPLDGAQYQAISQTLNLWVIAVLAVYELAYNGIYSSSRENAGQKWCDEEDEEKNMNFGALLTFF